MDMRTVQKIQENKWIDIEFKDLMKGDTFRLFESTGEPVLESNGSENGWLIAMDDPYLNEDSIWTIPTDFIR